MDPSMALNTDEELATQLTASRGPWNTVTGLVFESANEERIVATLQIDPAVHMQPAGLVHGGVWATVAETVASSGAFLNSIKDGKGVAGMEHHTSFMRPITTAQKVTVVGEAIHRGRSTHSWEIRITDEEGRLIARSYVRLAVLDR